MRVKLISASEVFKPGMPLATRFYIGASAEDLKKRIKQRKLQIQRCTTEIARLELELAKEEKDRVSLAEMGIT